MSQLSIEERVALILSIAENGGEVIGTDELSALLSSDKELITYDGFEPSGQMHISQGLLRAINVNKMIKAGFKFKMWVADWFGYLNNKMGGDLEKIKNVGRYFIEIWRASGMDLDNTEFIWASDALKDPKYWETFMRVGKSITLNRAVRATQIMGRTEKDDLTAGMIFYPCMQATDIFHVMKAQVTQLGLDQQKVNVIAREIGEELGFWKPIIVSHGMLQGLQKPIDKAVVLEKKLSEFTEGETIVKDRQISIVVTHLTEKELQLSFVNDKGVILRSVDVKENDIVKYFDFDITEVKATLKISKNTPERMISMKMSKSIPESSVFMTDTEEEVSNKIRKAYCPEGVVEENPILEYCKQIIFNAHFLKRETPLLKNGVFEVKRPEKFGGNVSYKNYAELETAFKSKELYPLDLKNAVTEYINELLTPVREHFKNNKEAKELLEKVSSYQVTR